MADLITRLKVDSTEYDAKIKRAAQGLQHYVQSAHDSGDVIGRLLGDTKKYVESLGNMATVSTTARGRLNELTAAFTDLRSVYNSLSEEEKSAKGGFGQELNKQLEILKGRINDTKNELKGIDQELGNTKQAEDGAKSGLEGLTSALGINLKSLAGWGTALAAGKVALDVAKDAFMSSEGNIDEWGRTVEGAKGAYDVFLQTINNGNWSSFFSNLNNAINGARDLYNALDRLGSIKSNNQAAIAIQQQQVQQLRLMKQQGKNVDDQLKAATERLATLQKQSVDAGKRAGSSMVGQTIRNGYQSQQGAGKLSGGTVDAVVNDIMKNGQKAFDKYAKMVADLEKKGTSTRHSNYGGSEVTYKTFDINNLTAEQQKQYRLAKTITDRETEIQKGISVYAQAVQEGASAAREELKGNRYAMAGTGGKGGKGNKKDAVTFADDSIMAQEKLVQELTQKWKTASGELRDGYLKDLTAAQNKLNEMTGKGAKVPEMTTGLSGLNEQTISAWTSMIKSQLAKENIGSDLYNSLTQNLADMSTLTTAVQDAMKLGLKIPQEDVQEMFEAVFDQGNLPEDLYAGMIQKFIDDFKERTGRDLEVGENGSLSVQKPERQKDKDDDFKKLNGEIGKLTGGLSQVTGGLKAFGIEIPKEVDQVIGVINGISQVISGVGSIISLFSTTALTANTAAIAANTVALTTNTATNFIPFFANGGIVPHAANGYYVPGNSFSGDNTPIMANAGELVLSKSQQGNLASQLEGGSMQNLNIDWVLTGDKLRAVMNNNGRRTGRGELVQRNRI